MLGGLAGYYRNNRALKFSGVILMGLHPIPYYIVAFVLLILFGYIWPVFPISGAYPMNTQPNLSLNFIGTVLYHSFLPALSLILVGIGGWFLGMRSLVSNVVTEDYVIYAELGGVDRNRILSSYVMRNALMPQVTGLAMALGSIFNGAIITEKVFGYPGIGNLLIAGGGGRRLQPRARRHLDHHHRGVGGGLPDRHALSAARSARAGVVSPC